MREKEFRGKFINQYTEEWVYGDLIQDKEGRMYIITDDYTPDGDGKIELNTCNSPEVVPETVGQYTEVKDKNKIKIFNGDIVEIDKDIAKMFRIQIKGVVSYLDGMFYVKYPDESFVTLQSLTALVDIEHNFRGKVIGNIHDNPELLVSDKWIGYTKLDRKDKDMLK